jgi:hypothetical protein
MRMQKLSEDQMRKYLARRKARRSPFVLWERECAQFRVDVPMTFKTVSETKSGRTYGNKMLVAMQLAGEDRFAWLDSLDDHSVLELKPELRRMWELRQIAIQRSL